MSLAERIGVFSLPAKMTGPEAVRYAAELGVGAFEPLASLEMAEPDEEQCALIKAEAEKLGIALPAISVGIDIIGKTADAAVERLKGAARSARRMGMKYLHHTVYLILEPENASEPFEKLLNEALPRAREVFDYAADIGIECIYEDQGQYFNGMKNFETFFEELDRPAGVVLDLGNIGFVGGNALEFAERWKEKIVHVHAKDYKILPYDPNKHGYKIGEKMLVPVLPGDGDMKVREALEVLKRTGYDGWIDTEHEAEGDPFEENRKCVDRLRELLA